MPVSLLMHRFGLHRARCLGRRVTLATIVLCALAGACGRSHPGGHVRPELQELAVAMAREPERPTNARLVGFAYAPPPTIRRGSGAPTASPDTRIAAARLEKLLADNPRPATWAAAGVAYLAIGESNMAVDALEEAVADAPSVSAYQSDLSAAYMARAVAEPRADDWAPALAAANRAIRLDPTLAEARFNRALALRGLHLRDLEAAAWREHAVAESSPDWLSDAAANGRYAAAEGDDGTRRQKQRESAETALGRWAAAEQAGRTPEARASLEEARRYAFALEADGGDTLPADEVRLIDKLTSDAKSLRRLATAHVRYDQSEQYSARDNLKAAAEVMAQATSDFARVGSAYAYWGPIAQATFLRHQKAAAEAMRQLKAVPVESFPARYHHLRGRFARVEGVLWGALGRYDLEREPLQRAQQEFEAAGELEQALSAQTLLAEVDWFLGDVPNAWGNVVAVTARTAALEAHSKAPTGLLYHLTIGATIATGLGLPEAAVDFLNARVSRSDSPRSEGFGHMLRGRLRAQIGDVDGARKDLTRAAAVLATLDDPGLREEAAADVSIANAELLQTTDCRAAIRHVDAALPSVRRALHSIRIVGLLAVKAKCRQALGDLDGATADLADAATSFERRRTGFSSAVTRIQAFEAERDAFKDLIALETVTRKDERAGLRVAERSRSGVLSEQWTFPFDATDERRLPDGVAVVYFESLDDRVLTWLLTRERRTVLTAPIEATRLRRIVVRIQRAVTDGADAERLRVVSKELTAALLHPALHALDEIDRPAHTLVVIPDGPLYGIPFAALPDLGGQPLVRARTIGVAPSLTALHAASRSLTRVVPSSVLAIGDGHDVAASRLPRLPGADEEAIAVGRQYPKAVVLTGAKAMKSRVLQERAAVLHFAGHTVVNQQFPAYSRLLLAPERGHDPGGALFGSDITPAAFGRVGIVVLASCDGAAGRIVNGEGAISVARLFFSAGVSTIVASLWPVQDDVREFAETLHRELRARGNPASALRAAQLALLDRRGAATPVRVWGGFISFGGIGQTS
jgi:CHAT domain-containing protein